LSKAIATFPVPILTGIGHSTNVTVAELVAHKSAITPTELGEFLIQCFHNFSVPINDALKIIKNKVQSEFKFSKETFQNELKMFRQVSITRFLNDNNDLKSISQLVTNESKRKMNAQKQEVYRYSELMKLQVENFNLKEKIQLTLFQKQLNFWNTNQKPFLVSKLEQLQQNLGFQSKNFLAKEEQLTKEKEQLVNLLNPQNVLKRGYAIPLYNGKIIDENMLPEINDEIELITYSHTLKTKLTKITKNEE